MENIHIGLEIDIKRSDGRIHQATVNKVNEKNFTVVVEWFEEGVSKAKELAMDTVVRVNPWLASNYVHPRMSLSSQTVTRSLATRTRVSSAHQPFNADGTLDGTLGIFDNVNCAPRRGTDQSVANRKSMLPNRFSCLDVSNRASRLAVIDEEKVMAPKLNEMKKTRQQGRLHTAPNTKKQEPTRNAAQINKNLQFANMIREYQSSLKYKPLNEFDSVVDHRICVAVRKRPMNSAEHERNEIEIITIPTKDNLIVHQPKMKVDLTKYLENQRFRFDYTFDENVSTELVYRFTAKPLVDTIFQGGFATCFAYGQTGSGKTHTMGGGFLVGKKQNPRNGIYALTATDVFNMLNSPEFKHQKLSVFCAFFEIYGVNVYDLLNKKAKLNVLEDGKQLVQVIGLKEVQVYSVEDVLKIINEGTDRRTAGQTSANSNSSRSHAIFQIILRKKEGRKDLIYGKFSLVDLAGNERGKHTSDSLDQQTRNEGSEINKSLLALKECVRAMARDQMHVPFRGSKLTLILRDSFIGQNAKTCMIATITPGMSSAEDTLNTLRYADRVKELVDDLPPDSEK